MDSKVKASSKLPKIKLLAANVLQKNEHNNHLVAFVKDLYADVTLFTEADNRWQDVIVKHLSTDYKYRVELS